MSGTGNISQYGVRCNQDLVIGEPVEQAFNLAISNPKGRFGGEVGLIAERIQSE